MENTSNEKNSGITLVALVITIIMLLILAGVTLNLTLGDNGLLKRAQEATNLYNIEEERERLEMVKATVAIENNGEVTVDKYVDKLIEEGITKAEDVIDNGDGSKEVTTDKGFVVTVKPDGEKDVIIEINGEQKETIVRILDVKLTSGTNNIKIDVETKRGDNAIYKYYYKEVSGEYQENPIYDGKESTYTINGLKQDTTYIIKVEVVKNGEASKEAVGKTGVVADAKGAIEFGNLEWNEGKASVTVTKTIEDNLEIKYIIKHGETIVKEESTIESGETITDLELGDVIIVYLTDGINKGETATITADELIAPNIAEVIFKSNTLDSITVTAKGEDKESGIEKYTFEYRKTGVENAEWNRLSNAEVITTEEQIDYTYSGLEMGHYELRVIVTDKSGNNKVSEVLITNTVLNRAPQITNTGTLSSNVATTATVKASATDADNNELTYTLYWSTNEDLSGAVSTTSEATVQGKDVNLSMTGLSGSKYYYRIDVTDGIDTTEGIIKTMTKCEGPFNHISCSTCGSSGQIPVGNCVPTREYYVNGTNGFNGIDYCCYCAYCGAWYKCPIVSWNYEYGLSQVRAKCSSTRCSATRTCTTCNRSYKM